MGVARVSSTARQSQHTRAIGRAVELALADIKKLQGRVTEELRVEDAARSLELHGREVQVLKADIDFIRPAILPMRPPGLPVGGLTPTPSSPMKKGVADFAAHVHQVQSRLTEELRIEDAIVSVTLKGAKVEVRYWKATAFGEDAIKDFARRELASRCVTLPISFKVKDPRDV